MNELLLPIQVDGNDEQEVEEILASKVVHGSSSIMQVGKVTILTMAWYPAWNFTGCLRKLKEFHDQYPEQPGPPRYLDEWLECWHSDDDRRPVEHWDKNALKA